MKITKGLKKKLKIKRVTSHTYAIGFYAHVSFYALSTSGQSVPYRSITEAENALRQISVGSDKEFKRTDLYVDHMLA